MYLEMLWKIVLIMYGDIYIDKVIIPASDIRELNDIVTIFTNERITQRMGAK